MHAVNPASNDAKSLGPTTLTSLGECLLRYEDEHRALIEESPDLVARFDNELRFAYINPTMAEALGRPASFFLGRRPDELVGWNARIGQVVQDGRESNFEFTWDGGDGRGKRTYESRLIPERRREGRAGSVLAVSKDVTEHRASAVAARESQQYLRALVADSSDLLAVLDAEGIVRFSSDSSGKLLGLLPDEFIGQNVFGLIHPEDRTRVAATFAETLAAGGSGRRAEARVRHADGSWRLFEVLGKSVHLESGTTSVILNARDVTERRRLEALVQRSQRTAALGRMAHGISHEFNNLFSTILGTCELLATDLSDAAEMARGVGVIQQAGQSAATLTQHLAAFGQNPALHPEAIDVADLLTDLRPRLADILGASVRLQLDASPGSIADTDRALLAQVILDLASNARERMPEGGTLKICAQELADGHGTCHKATDAVSARSVLLSIHDSGPAMDAQSIARILDPFGASGAPEGSDGFALAAVQSLLESAGAVMEISSAPGIGNDLLIYVPAATATTARRFRSMPLPVTPISPNAGWDTIGGTETILVVEDEPAVLDITIRFLNRLGYKVVAAADPETALAIATRNQSEIHLVLCDVDLPGMSGPALYRQLAAIRPELAVIFVSGYAGDREDGHAGVPDDATFLQKPYSVITLGEALRARLGRSTTPLAQGA